jgi:hypothetical protein
MDSNSSETVAVISLGGATLGGAAASQVNSAPVKSQAAGKTASSSSVRTKGAGSCSSKVHSAAVRPSQRSASQVPSVRSVKQHSNEPNSWS